MHRNLDISQLRTLVTIVDAGGFRRAAEVLSLTQPAVSQHVRRLEAFLEGPVFTSTGRTLALSAAGEELLAYARRIVLLNDEAVLRFVAPRSRLRLALGVSQQLADGLPQLLSELSRRVPGAQLTVRTGLSEPLASCVTSGDLDFAVLVRPVRDDRSRPLGRLRLGWFGTPPGPRERSVPLALSTEPCNTRRHTLDSLNARDATWHIAYEGGDLAGLRAAAQVGLGIACLVANGDELWGLPRVEDGMLPAPPQPIPVSLAVAPGTSAMVSDAAYLAARAALRGYPLVETAWGPAGRAVVRQAPAAGREGESVRGHGQAHPGHFGESGPVQVQRIPS